MTKLNKSIRHCMDYYGSRLRSGHYGALRHTLGQVPPDFRYVNSVYCDVVNGVCTDIRLYCVGDAVMRSDWEGASINITDPLVSYLKGELNWNEMIGEIEYIIEHSEEGCSEVQESQFHCM